MRHLLQRLVGFGNRGALPQYNFTISSSENNWNLDTELAAVGYVSGPISVIITVDAAVVVGSTSATAGMTLQAQEAGSYIHLINNGTINGRGGVANGGAGGDALVVSQACDLTNNGTIFGGGGAGGKGGNRKCDTCDGPEGTGVGGNGGAGEGNSSAASGSGGSTSSGGSHNIIDESCVPSGSFNVTGGTGGAGGTKGTAGSNGATPGGGTCYGGTLSSTGGSSGGAAGNWANGHSNLNILVAGTVFGGTTG